MSQRPYIQIPEPASSYLKALLAIALLLLSFSSFAKPPETKQSIRIATLKFGTLNWELDTMQHQKLDREHGFQLMPLNLASVTATRTALLSGNTDVIVADWLWVSRQRDRGIKLQFVPYSSSIGKLVLAKGSKISSLNELQGKRIGIAGGPVDKSWLLLQASALQQGLDLKKANSIQYAAPALLNAALQQGDLDAVLTYWHYAARLEGQQYPVLLNMREINHKLGLGSDLAMLGFVFKQSWAEQHPSLVKSMVAASMATKHYLRDTPRAWERLRPLMRAEDDSVFNHLKKGYIAGIPNSQQHSSYPQARQMFDQLAPLGGKLLLGSSRRLDPDSFWSPATTLSSQ